MDDSQKTDLLLKYLELDRKAKDIIFQLSEDADQVYGFVFRLKKAYDDNEELDQTIACMDVITRTPVYDIIKRIGSNIVLLLIQFNRQRGLKDQLAPLFDDNGN